MKPLIGLLTEINDECTAIALSSYSLAIEKAGGVPIVLPYTESDSTIGEYIKACQGIVFTGGADISPSIYGDDDPLALCQPPQRKRDEHELRLLRAVLAEGKPILAICRGMQLLNAALGGTLYQHIPCHKGGVSHKVAVYKGNELHDVLGDVFTSNSFHHQAIKRPADGVRIIARAADGIIEAFDVPDAGRFIMGVQWHPEKTFKANGEKKSADIVRLFVEKCAK